MTYACIICGQHMGRHVSYLRSDGKLVNEDGDEEAACPYCLVISSIRLATFLDHEKEPIFSLS